MNSILLVDDSGLFRAVRERIERRTHCRLLTARSGTEALAVARRERPDLIFLDAEMEGMTGFDVSRVLKADPHFAHTPIVIVSASQTAEEEGRRSGADRCLAKPLDEAEIFDSIGKYFQLQHREGARAPVGWSVTFWRDGTQHDGLLRDLSRGGFYIRTAVRQPIGARLEISFEVPGGRPGRTVVAEAIVVRMGPEPDPGLGCRFFRVTAASRANLEECLRMLEGGEAAIARVKSGE